MTRFFVHKAWLAGAGLVVGLAGMAQSASWLIWVAIGLVGAAFVLRLVERAMWGWRAEP